MMEKQFVAPQGYLPTSNKVNRNLPSKICVVFNDINKSTLNELGALSNIHPKGLEVENYSKIESMLLSLGI